MVFATPRPGLELRLFEDRHAEELFACVDRERAYLREWLSWPDLNRSVEDSRQFIQRNLRQFADNLGFGLGLWWEGQFVGTVGTLPIDWTHHSTEIGYWIARDFQGRGLVTDSVRAVVRHSFLEWKLNRIVIRVATGNIRSSGIPRRLGFTLEGVARQVQLLHGRYVDLQIFSLLAEEWRREGSDV